MKGDTRSLDYSSYTPYIIHMIRLDMLIDPYNPFRGTHGPNPEP